MNNLHEEDELDDVLGRAGDYLMRRTAEYREAPVVSQLHSSASPKRRRVLVGAAAIATLSVTALAGSFIGGSSSGKVEIAEAAWSAVPSAPTDDLIKQSQNNCHITNETLAGYEGATVATFPQDMLEPSLIDVRGTTTTAVYFTPTHAVLCVQFADGSVYVNDLGMGPNDGNDGNGWENPSSIVAKIEANGSPEPFTATMIVGYLPDGTNWDAFIKVDGIETVAATTSAEWSRYVAWIPGDVSGLVAFKNKWTDEGIDRPFGRSADAPWLVAPETTVQTQVSDQGAVTPLGEVETTVPGPND
jgi:hypothetical protein